MDVYAEELELRVDGFTEIWRRVLGDPLLHRDSNLFDSGGSSMHVLQISGDIYTLYGIDVSLRDIFLNPTPDRLARVLVAEL
jgi:hypothetical protein